MNDNSAAGGTPIPESAEERPWRSEMGVPPPRVTVYEYGKEPALWVHASGRWRYAVVRARHDWADGRIAYQVDLKLPGFGSHDGSVSRIYWWGQPALHVAHGPGDRRRQVGPRNIDSA